MIARRRDVGRVAWCQGRRTASPRRQPSALAVAENRFCVNASFARGDETAAMDELQQAPGLRSGKDCRRARALVAHLDHEHRWRQLRNGATTAYARDLDREAKSRAGSGRRAGRREAGRADLLRLCTRPRPARDPLPVPPPPVHRSVGPTEHRQALIGVSADASRLGSPRGHPTVRHTTSRPLDRGQAAGAEDRSATAPTRIHGWLS
jgi:hypothetical protein